MLPLKLFRYGVARPFSFEVVSFVALNVSVGVLEAWHGDKVWTNIFKG
jgi:hypothetical protein